MFFSYVAFLIVIIFFCLCSLEDIKKKETYNYLNFGFAFLILILALFEFILTKNYNQLIFVFFGGVLSFAIGSILFFFRVWGGGDSKFLMGFGFAFFYLLPYLNLDVKTFFLAFKSLEFFFKFGFDFFIFLVLSLDVLGLILISFLFLHINSEDKKNSIILFLVILILFCGIFFRLDNLFLSLFGFLSFLLIFFSQENLFKSNYIKMYTKTSNLKYGDMLSQKTANFVDLQEQLQKKDIVEIKEKIVRVKKILPFWQLITLTYIVYLFKIIAIDITTFSLFFYLIFFVFLSFLVGGIFGFGVFLKIFLVNFKKIKIKFNSLERILILIFSTFFLFFIFFDFNIALIFVLLLIFVVCLRFGKVLENFHFLVSRPLEKIVPGDWVCQDVYLNGKLIYAQEEFKFGIDYEQIKFLLKLSKENPNKLKTLYVKDGIAFIPHMFVSFLILVLI